MAFFVILLRSDIAFGSYIYLRQVIFTFGEFWHSLRGAIDFVAIAITRRRCSSRSVSEHAIVIYYRRRLFLIVLPKVFLSGHRRRYPFGIASPLRF